MNMNTPPKTTETSGPEAQGFRFKSIEEARASLAKDMKEWADEEENDLVRKDFLETRMSNTRVELGSMLLLQERAQTEAAAKISEANDFADIGGPDVARIDRERKYNVGTSPQA